MNYKLIPDNNDAEKRKLSQSPSVKTLTLANLNEFVSSYEIFFNDNFGFRQILISINSTIRITLFNASAIKKVVIGKNNWLFYDNPADGIGLDSYLGRSSFSKNQLDLISAELASWSQRPENNGKKILLVIAPDKQTIYPEKLPRGINKIGESQMDQIMETGSISRQGKVLDLRNTISNAKKVSPVYYKTDTHWNKFGALVAFQSIERTLSENSNIPSSEYEVKNLKVNHGGDLATMLSASNLYQDEESVVTNSPSFCDENIKQSKILVFHDSFGDALIPYFSECSPKSIFIASPTPEPSKVIKENPDVIIWEIAERYLNRLTTEWQQ